MPKFFTWASVVIAAACLSQANANADVVMDWNEIALANTVAAKELPPVQSRTMAMVHVAMFDALNAIERRYRPYETKSQANAGASKDAAAAAAARTILVKLYPDARDALEKAYADTVARIPAGEDKAGGAAIGEAVGAELLALHASDVAGARIAYRPFTAKATYAPTMLPVSVDAAAFKPWIMERPDQFRPDPPPALASEQWSADYNEVKDLGGKTSAKRTQDQTSIARFWAMTGPATWNPIVRQLSASRKLSVIENARVFAMAHMAGADAFIAVFDAKYQYNFWRPITAIRNGDIDDNNATEREPAWLPLIDTPMHPEYPCAHCITSAAVGVVLETQFGSGQVGTFTMTNPAAPGVIRTWDRIGDYVEEVSNARVWGGIHYRTSAKVAQEMGRKIGRLAITTVIVPEATP
jgi:hypothetical protein